jgi:hypothetical protein
MTNLTTALLAPVLALGFWLLISETSANEILDGPSPPSGPGVSSFANPSGFAPYTQRRTMHACPPNRYMSGVHVANNWFLCANFAGTAYTPDYEANSDESIDPSAQNNGVPNIVSRAHACPTGLVMSGYHQNKDLLLCVPSPFGNNGVRTRDFNPESSAGGTIRADMHACPSGQVMAGIDYNENILLCEAPSSAFRPGDLKDRTAK